MGNLIGGFFKRDNKLSKKPNRRWRKSAALNKDFEWRLNVPSQEMEGCSSSGYRRTKDENNKIHPNFRLMDDLEDMESLPYYNNLPPLHRAIMTGRLHIIPDLLKCGADINGRGYLSETALHVASEMLIQEAIEILLHCGANINLTTLFKKKTALHLAVWSSSCKAGILLETTNTCVELLLFNGANVHMKDSEGQEAIHYACQNGREDIIMLLYNYGADMGSLTEQKESPLFLFLENVSNLRKVNVLKKLLSLSYPLKLINREGRLPYALCHPSGKQLKDMLRREALEVWSLQDICKFNVRNIYRGTKKYSLINTIPINLWKSIFFLEEYSYASRIKDYFA
ncbi:ankyrin repeat domain-containing protein 61-like [Sceloporus undulatus]|uniref:ankyrin repeat domain-containing protein 61-like n=1 Tax=Sceloporus undulatus TaxID=8520 RepID=UPI001C4BD6C5|nr:ankyrin repeat domain-containing protein 61-like [Sceloporus undulatus]